MVVQWFPKIGVFEEKGWNCHQFHASTEFFSDFGNYDVSIDVPARYKGKVGATGQRVDERETSAGRVLYRFRQQGVHDFACTVATQWPSSIRQPTSEQCGRPRIEPL